MSDQRQNDLRTPPAERGSASPPPVKGGVREPRPGPDYVWDCWTEQWVWKPRVPSRRKR